MAILINGNGNPAIYAAQDADLIASLAGNTTGIAKVGNECAYSAQDANTISVADGVIVTKEGRRIQLDAGENDTFIIPAGTVGVTNYYIIGYQLHENASGQQVADTFVQLMANATETIQEDTFRGGASDVYVSLYRVEQDGINLGTITLLLPKLTNISQINNDLAGKENKLVYIDGTTGTATTIYVDDSYEEILISLEDGINNTYYSISVNINEIKISAGTTYYAPFGHYTSEDNNSGGKVRLYDNASTHKVSVQLNSYYYNGTSSASGVYVKVYAR